jgi:hypothetical protein
MLVANFGADWGERESAHGVRGAQIEIIREKIILIAMIYLYPISNPRFRC